MATHELQGPDYDWAVDRGDKWRTHIAGLEAMLAPIDAPLIDALRLTGPLRVADVGCGGGATTFAAMRRAPHGSVVHGFDVSPALVDVARQRQSEPGASVVFAVADMGAATPPARPYDRLVSRMGVMFFAHPPSAFANLRRWLGPDGRFAFAAWGPVEDNVWFSETRAAVADAIAVPDMDAAGPGPFRYADVGTLVTLLDDAGFDEVTVLDWRQALPMGGHPMAAGAARFALAAFWRFAEQLAAAGGEAASVAARALTRRFAAYEVDGRVMMPARVHILSGRAGRARA